MNVTCTGRALTVIYLIPRLLASVIHVSRVHALTTDTILTVVHAINTGLAQIAIPSILAVLDHVRFMEHALMMEHHMPVPVINTGLVPIVMYSIRQVLVSRVHVASMVHALKLVRRTLARVKQIGLVKIVTCSTHAQAVHVQQTNLAWLLVNPTNVIVRQDGKELIVHNSVMLLTLVGLTLPS